MPSDRGERVGLDYEAVRAYWEAAAEDANSASYMAHEQGLPPACVQHRFALEREVIDRWFAMLPATASVLDLGCGAGAWTEHFARRYRQVVGVDVSGGMVAAARQRVAGLDNVSILRGDALSVELEGEFDGVLLGGLLMYLERADAVNLLVRLRELAPSGRIILRESGVRAGVEAKTGTYQVVYRSLSEYGAIAAEAGLRVVAVERNEGYAHMEMAVALVDLLRRLPPLARLAPAAIGGRVWRFLAATAPLSLDRLPRALEALGFDFPHLTNNFLLLEASAPRAGI